MVRAARNTLVVGVTIAVMSIIGLRPSDASATTIFLDVPPTVVDQPPLPGFFDIDFFFGGELNGIVLAGQSISLDFVFDDSVLARVIGNVCCQLGLGVSIQTNAGTFPGFAGDDSTGFVLAPNGSPLHDPMLLGRAASSSGDVIVGLSPPLGNFEMSGVHYDVTLPNTGYQITGGTLRLSNNSRDIRVDFGTPAQLPDGGSPLWFLVLSLASLALFAHRQRRITTPP